MSCCKNSNNEIKVSETNSEEFVCYCFKYSKLDLVAAIEKGDELKILDDIKAKIKSLGCFCETANPSGKCCLPEINSFIKNSK
jgi:NAD(P)H-nitrite reductase large subunit